jgi:hypothetical protein
MMVFGWIGFAFFLLWFPSTAGAANVDISGEPRKLVTLAAESSTVGQILQDLGGRYGFQIKGIENARTAEIVSARMSGTLYDVVARLLRNRNYMIVLSPESASGIERVMILDANYGSAPTEVVQSPGEHDEDLVGALSRATE